MDKRVVQVCCFGAFGGLISCLLPWFLGAGQLGGKSLYVTAPMSMLFGVGAAFVGTLLLAASEGDAVRLGAVCIICGFSWRIVYEAGEGMLEKRAGIETSREVRADLEQSTNALRTGANTRAPQREAVLEVASKAADLARQPRPADPNVWADAKTQYRDSLEALTSSAHAEPDAAAQGIGEVALAATMGGHDALARDAITRLEQLRGTSPASDQIIDEQLAAVVKAAESANLAEVKGAAEDALAASTGASGRAGAPSNVILRDGHARGVEHR